MNDSTRTSRQDSEAPFEGIAFDNSYAHLPDHFFQRVEPTSVAAPRLIRVNEVLAEQLGIDPEQLASPEGIEMLAGNRPAAGAEPLAMGYAGHQFANWVPQLGDGRALLLGEVIGTDGVRYDIQLKGSGPTRYSRGGDGRSSIGPVVREYLASEAMAALGIPTTRALAAVATGEEVIRNDGPEPGGILCRIARSHVRVGTFEYFARNGNPDSVRVLADYVIDRHYPELSGQDDRYPAFFDQLIEQSAKLISDWMRVGFIHGVMNTDNTSVAAETIDFGPFGWMDEFDPATVYSSIDRRGRYAWNQQPAIAYWNLARLGECLLPLLGEDIDAAVERANAMLGRFPDQFERHYQAALRDKLGLVGEAPGDADLAQALLTGMADNSADMTLTFRHLSSLNREPDKRDQAVREQFDNPEVFDHWAEKWRQRLNSESRSDAERQAAMRQVNPAFVLRNHLAQQAVDAAIQELDFVPMHQLHRVLQRPYDDQPEHADYARPPKPEQRVLKTFCGT